MSQTAAVIEFIRVSFANTRVPTQSLGDLADAFYGIRPEAPIHAARHWSEVTPQLLAKGHGGYCDTILARAPDPVWAHYLPALMIGALQDMDSTDGIRMALPVLTLIVPLPPDYAFEAECRARLSLFDADQTHAIRMFVRVCLTKDLWWSMSSIAGLRPRLIADWAGNN